MSLTKDGFYKSFSGAIGNNNYLLEAGGGHIAWGNAANRIPYSNGTVNTNLNADMTDGLHVHGGRNNEANKIVRTDGSGYIQAGWINTTSGDMGSTAFSRIYVSNDAFIRYVSIARFKTVLFGGQVGSPSVPIYWTGSAFATCIVSFGNSSYGEHNANNINDNGIKYYNSNGPSTSLGATTSDGALYSQAYNTSWVAQIAQDYRNGGLYVRGKNNGTWQSWYRVWDNRTTYVSGGKGYIGSTEITQVNNSDTVDGHHQDHLLPYCYTYGAQTNSGSANWYVRIQTASYISEDCTIYVRGTGNNTSSDLVIHVLCRENRFWGWETSYNGVRINGIAKETGAPEIIYLRMPSSTTSITFKSTHSLTIDKADYSSKSYMSLGEGLFANYIYGRIRNADYADTLSNPGKYYWANLSMQTSPNTSTSPTFNITTHNGEIQANAGIKWAPGTNIRLPQSANGQEWSFDISRNGYTGGYWHVWDSAYGSLLTVYATEGDVLVNRNLGVGGRNTTYKLYVVGNSLLTGTTYFGSTSYWINNGGVEYMYDIRGSRIRLVDNWVGFYTSNNAGGNRLGYIQTDGSYMYFRKENGNAGFNFNGNLVPSSNLAANIGTNTLSWNRTFTRYLDTRHLDATAEYTGDMTLYIGYGAVTPTQTINFYYSTGTRNAAATSRIHYAQLNSNGLYALVRFGVNGQNTGYTLHVNGTGNFENNIWVRGSGVYLRLGPQNSSHAHYETNAGTSHWFNKRVDVNGAIWRYGTNYGIADNGRFYALSMYANRSGSSTDGGLSLYSDSDPMTYGIAFRGTGSYGKLQGIQSDWATYLTMNDDTSRGWMFRRGSTNVLAIDGFGSLNRFYIYRLRLPGATAKPVGWYQMCRISGLDGYFNFNLLMTGGWNSGAPTMALLNIACYDTTPVLTQISGKNNGVITKIRLRNISGGNYYLDVYQAFGYTSSNTMSDQYFLINGSVRVTEIVEPTAVTSATGGTELAIQDISGHLVNRENAYWANLQVQSSSRTDTSPTVSTIYASNWFRSKGNTGWYSESYGGGIRMTDSSWIRTYGSKNFYVEGGNFAVSGNAAIGTTSFNYRLYINGDSYATGWSRAGSGFYCESTGVHFTHQGSVGEIDMTSNNEFLWGSSGSTLYFNYRGVSRGTTVNNYIWNAGSSSSWANHNMGNIWLNGSGVYLRLGPQNGTYAHYETNAGTSHWFNKRIDVDGDIYLYGTSTRIQKSNQYVYAKGFYHLNYGSAYWVNRTDGGAACFNYGSKNASSPSYVWGWAADNDYRLYSSSYLYKSATHTISNPNTSNTWLRIATITISGTGLSIAGFTAIFSNRECLDNTSFILTLSIRRNNTTSAAGVEFYYNAIQGSLPRTISLRSNDNQTFYVYFQSAASSWTTYYNVTKIMTEGNVTYENVGTTSPIAGSITNVNASKGGNVLYSSSLLDRTNGTTTYANYGASGLGLGSITWLTCWNGYELRAISKGELGGLTNVYQHTTNNVNYPLVWSNQNNTSTVQANQLHKSYSDLVYNPANKEIKTWSFAPQGESTNRGIHFPGGAWINSIGTSIIFRNATIRFGGSGWDWNAWAGLNFDGNTTINIGMPDNSIFTANSAKTAGTIRTVNSKIEVFPNGNSNYGEGIRIHAASNGWTTLMLAGTDNTGFNGTTANSWSLHANGGNFYLNKNGSSNQQAARLWGRSSGYTVGNINWSSYTLEVADVLRVQNGIVLGGYATFGTHYMTGAAGRIYFGGNFHIDSIGRASTYDLYLNYYAQRAIHFQQDRMIMDSEGKMYVANTGVRRAGIYGIYDSYKIGHIWSMGTSYVIANDGSTFGNLYGLAYKHTNNGTGGTMAGGHQAVWCDNGNPRAAMGYNGFWAAGGFYKNGSSNNYALTGAGGHFGIHTGRNNEANKIVRTDGSGYIQAGWINTTSGGFYPSDAAISRVYCSNDDYLRYLSPSDFINRLNAYWANIKVSSSSSTATSPTFSTCYTTNWFRSKGNTGWYSESYGGGWWMTDSTWLRNYNNKPLFMYTSGANSSSTPIARFVKGWDCGDRSVYDTVVISSNDCTSLRLIEQDGTCTGIAAGDNYSTFTSAASNGMRFFVHGNNSSNIYGGMSGDELLWLRNGSVGIKKGLQLAKYVTSSNYANFYGWDYVPSLVCYNLKGNGSNNSFLGLPLPDEAHLGQIIFIGGSRNYDNFIWGVPNGTGVLSSESSYRTGKYCIHEAGGMGNPMHTGEDDDSRFLVCVRFPDTTNGYAWRLYACCWNN